jgi:hypothetical protein
VAQGKLQQIIPKATKTGKKFLSINIDGQWGSYWGPIPADAKGATVEYESEQNGDFTNYKNVVVVAPAEPAAEGKPTSEKRSSEYWDRRDIEIRRMSVLRTATQLVAGRPARKGETATDTLTEVFAIADKMSDYVVGSAPDVKTPPRNLPTGPADDSIFPKD